MSIIVTFILLACVPMWSSPIVDHMDIVELNTVICEQTGNETLTQWIWWKHERRFFVDGQRSLQLRWDYCCVDWRSTKWVVPMPIYRDGRYVQQWYDHKTRAYRIVESRVYRHTITLFDPELKDRERVPEASRTRLSSKGRNKYPYPHP
jgi:hypothetical protein